MRFCYLDKILFLFFSCWIMIDSINGFARTVGFDYSISQILKFGLFFIIFIRMFYFKSIRILSLLLIVYFIFITISVNANGNDVFSSIVLLIKPISTFYFFLYFVWISKYYKYFFDSKIIVVILCNVSVFAANIILGLLGFGNQVYNIGEDETLGVKGFILSSNEMSLVAAVLFPMSLWYLIHKIKKIFYYLTAFFIVFLSFCISTKATIITAILSFIFVTYFMGSKIERKIIVIITTLLLILSITYLSVILSSDIGFIQRFSFFVENRGLLDAVFSGRIEQYETESDIFFNKYNSFNYALFYT